MARPSEKKIDGILSSANRASTDEALVSGTVLDRYQLVHRLAAGGMGTVWAGQVTGHLRRQVAIKIPHPELVAATVGFREMFLDEARIASLIHHPNVCTVHDLGVADGVLYMVMEWVSGLSLNTLLVKSPDHRLDPRVAARIAADACAGLHAAHELKDEMGQPMHVVHRDVSPHNVLVSIDGTVKIADFGVARANGQLHARTETGDVKGKVHYVAPEQVLCQQVDRRADIFAIGTVLYEMVVGDRPFSKESVAANIYCIAEGKFDAPRSRNPSVPEALEAIILRAMATDANSRYQTADEMRLDLEETLARLGGPVTPSHVAAVLKSHMGSAIEQQEQHIRRVAESLLPDTSASLRALRHTAMDSLPSRGNASSWSRRPPPVDSTGISKLSFHREVGRSLAPGARRPRWPLLLGTFFALVALGLGVRGVMNNRSQTLPSAIAQQPQPVASPTLLAEPVSSAPPPKNDVLEAATTPKTPPTSLDPRKKPAAHGVSSTPSKSKTKPFVGPAPATASSGAAFSGDVTPHSPSSKAKPKGLENVMDLQDPLR